MNKEISNISQLEQEFAYVDSLITAHTNAAVAKVNAEALQTYWEVGAYISDRFKESAWGNKVVSELADYLKRHNPKRRGYGKRNLYNMVKFYETYSVDTFSQLTEQLKLSEFVQSQTAQIESRPIVQKPSAQLQSTLLPSVLCLTSFSNHTEIINRCSTFEERPITVFLVKVKDAETLEANHVRQQLFDNLQPILQPNLQPNLQDIEDKYKRLMFSIDIYLIDAKDLLKRYLSCNHLATIMQPIMQPSCNHHATLSRQAFAKSVLRPAIKQGYVSMLYPETPKTKKQMYYLTEKGLMVLSLNRKQNE